VLSFGDAYYGDKSKNDAYSYIMLLLADNSLIRAKNAIGSFTKGAKAYTEAKCFNDVIATNLITRTSYH
jgi:hypothetical protein